MAKPLKIQVTIVKETRKAKLVQDAEGRQAWVQNRSYTDGLVNKTVFEKGLAFLAERAEDQAAQKEHNKSLIELDVIWQSEKAITIDRTAEFTQASSLYHQKRVRVFFPKSVCQFENGGWQVKGWLFDKKSAEALDKIQMPNAPHGYQFRVYE